MNRRSFFGNLGMVIAAAAAPTIFVPKLIEPVQWKRSPFGGIRAGDLYVLHWSKEMEQDLLAMHGIKVDQVIDRWMQGGEFSSNDIALARQYNLAEVPSSDNVARFSLSI